jgi:phage terminase large subunit GpA-like protein
MDEVTGYLADVDGRGSPRDQARARQKMYGDLAKEWQGSTPGIAGECAITVDFEAGDRRYFYVPCPHCAVRQALTPAMLHGPEEQRGLPSHLRCQSCDGAILDGHKADLLAGGEWIATRVREGDEPVPATIRPDDMARWRCSPCEGRCRDWQPSYHLWAAYAPRERLGAIWDKSQLAEGDATKMRVFCQQDLAEPYDPGGVAVEWERLTEAAQASTYPRGVVPLGTALLVSAADVQGYGIKWLVYAIGPRGQRWLVDREVFEGAPDQSDAPWIALADALGRQYPTPSGAMKGIDLSGVDSGFATDRVYRFCAGRPNCYALDGRHDQGRPWLGTPVSDEITISGVLFPVECGGQGSLDGVIAAAQAGEPLMFVSGDAAEGRIYGYHTIQGVEEDRSFILGDGRARKNAYQIKLKRYEGEVTASGGIASLISLLG